MQLLVALLVVRHGLLGERERESESARERESERAREPEPEPERERETLSFEASSHIQGLS